MKTQEPYEREVAIVYTSTGKVNSTVMRVMGNERRTGGEFPFEVAGW